MCVASGPVPSVTRIISSSLRLEAKPSMAVVSKSGQRGAVAGAVVPDEGVHRRAPHGAEHLIGDAALVEVLDESALLVEGDVVARADAQVDRFVGRDRGAARPVLSTDGDVERLRGEVDLGAAARQRRDVLEVDLGQRWRPAGRGLGAALEAHLEGLAGRRARAGSPPACAGVPEGGVRAVVIRVDDPVRSFGLGGTSVLVPR